MVRRFSINFALLSMLFDICSVALGLWGAGALRPFLNSLAFIEPVPSPVYLPSILLVVFPAIWLLIFSALNIYDGRKFLRAADEFATVSLGMAIAAVSAAGILYLSFREVSRALFLVFVVVAYILGIAWRTAARGYFRLKRTSLARTRRILIVGAGPLGQRVRAQIAGSQFERLALIGFVDDSADSSTAPQLLGSQEAIRSIVVAKEVTDVVLALPHSAYERLSTIVQRLEGLPLRVWVALGFFDLALYKTEIEDFAGIPMLDLRASAMDDYQRMVKRAFDVIFGGGMLLVALPLMAVISAAIFLDTGRPVFFRQRRAGENGRLFEMLKFRTMIPDAERLASMSGKTDPFGRPLHKLRDDPRVTRVGRFLRRFSLDELPQLFNIVGGTMSLVGPRPELPFLVEQYQPWQRKRFAVPPGLTGWWQVNGRSDKPMHLHTEDDLYYIQNYSIWLDLQILVRTAWVVLVGKGAY